MKVSIIGLGATAKDFKPDGSISIGVNDVQGCDYKVIVDMISAFSKDRINSIFSDKFKVLFTQLPEWSFYEKVNKDFRATEINLKAVHAHNNRWNEFIPSSNNSPFVACGVAYKFFAATEIYLYGVDFNDHPNINGAMREQAVEDFKLLQKILNARGCFIYPHQDSYLYGKI